MKLHEFSLTALVAVDITVTTRSRGKITGKLQLDKDHSVVFATARTINENKMKISTTFVDRIVARHGAMLLLYQ